jgi:hypothetical protein
MWLLIGRGSLGATEPRIAGLMLDGLVSTAFGQQYQAVLARQDAPNRSW